MMNCWKARNWKWADNANFKILLQHWFE